MRTQTNVEENSTNRYIDLLAGAALNDQVLFNERTRQQKSPLVPISIGTSELNRNRP